MTNSPAIPNAIIENVSRRFVLKGVAAAGSLIIAGSFLRGSSAPPEPYTPPPREVVREVVYLPAYYPPDYAYYLPAYYLTLPFGIVRQHRHVATATSTMMRRK